MNLFGTITLSCGLILAGSAVMGASPENKIKANAVVCVTKSGIEATRADMNPKQLQSLGCSTAPTSLRVDVCRLQWRAIVTCSWRLLYPTRSYGTGSGVTNSMAKCSMWPATTWTAGIEQSASSVFPASPIATHSARGDGHATSNVACPHPSVLPKIPTNLVLATAARLLQRLFAGDVLPWPLLTAMCDHISSAGRSRAAWKMPSYGPGLMIAAARAAPSRYIIASTDGPARPPPARRAAMRQPSKEPV